MPRACQVTFQDLDGIRHTVNVEADSVYEAACLAIRAFKKAGFVEQQPGAASKFEVRVYEPVVTHEVTLGQVQRWLKLGSSNRMRKASGRGCGSCYWRSSSRPPTVAG